MTEWEGKLTVKLHNAEDLTSFCKRYVPGFDAGRYKPVAVRVFAAGEFIVTIYALDHMHEGSATGNLNVKKFKLENVTMQQIFHLAESFNFTLSSPDYPLEEMRVMNR